MPTLPATILDHLRTLRGEGRTARSESVLTSATKQEGIDR